jgi:uncharacterized protein
MITRQDVASPGSGSEPVSQFVEMPLPHGFTRRQINSAITPLTQKLTLFPTEKCNFRCTYCYEDFEIGKMSQDLQRSVERLVERRVPTLKELQFSWFGGEPLLAKDVVLRLLKHAKNACDENGVRFISGMTTNAYLLEYSLAEELLSYGQDFYQITLDGIGDEHDKLRRRADGAGTFDRIWDNLVAMKKLPGNFDGLIRVHVRRDNIQNLELLMAEVKREFGEDRRYRLDFQHLRNMGGEGGRTVSNPLSLDELEGVKRHLLGVYHQTKSTMADVSLPMNSSEVKVVVKDATATAVRSAPLPESAGSRRRDEMSSTEPYVCYAAKPNNLIIRANGRVGKCTVALDDKRNDLGYLDVDGNIVIDHEKHKLWFRGLETLDLETAGCPLRGMPKYEGKSPTPEEPIRWLTRTPSIIGEV